VRDRLSQRRGLERTEERDGDWIQKYQAKCSGTTIAYNATGSGAGVMQFNGGQVDFGGSDAALWTRRRVRSPPQTSVVVGRRSICRW
jgi:ABC-type phosphate transport system, periplasmic component